MRVLEIRAATQRGWIGRHEVELLLSLRMMIAALLTFILADAFGLQQGYWGVLTVVIVMQSSVGASLKATLERIVGTVGGAVWAVLASALVDRGGSSPEIVALLVALAPLTILAAFKPIYRVAPITAIIILLGSVGQHGGPVAAGLDRVLDILLGCAVAFAVSLLVWPSRAHTMLAQSADDVLEATANGVARIDQGGLVGASLDRIRSSVIRAAAVADEVKRERRNHLTDAPDPDPLLRTLRRVRHDLETIGRAWDRPLAAPIGARLAGPISHAASAVAGALRSIGAALAGRETHPSVSATVAALNEVSRAVEESRQDGHTLACSAEEAARMFGLAYAFEHLRTDIDDLANRAREFAGT